MGDRWVGLPHWCRRSRLVSSDHFHAVTTDFRSRKGGSRRYVAGAVHDVGELGGISAASTPNSDKSRAGAQRPTLNTQVRGNKSNLKHQTSKISLVVGILSLACSGFSRERTHRVDTAAHGLSNNRLDPRLAATSAFQIPAWNFANA